LLPQAPIGTLPNRRKWSPFIPALTPEIAHEAVELIRALYVIEKQASGLALEQRLQLRQTHSAPVLAQLREKFWTWKE